VHLIANGSLFASLLGGSSAPCYRDGTVASFVNPWYHPSIIGEEDVICYFLHQAHLRSSLSGQFH
jgi:hypothetical protein